MKLWLDWKNKSRKEREAGDVRESGWSALPNKMDASRLPSCRIHSSISSFRVISGPHGGEWTPMAARTEMATSLTYGKSTTIPTQFTHDLFASQSSCYPCPSFLYAAIWQGFRAAIITSQWFIETLTYFKFSIYETNLTSHLPSVVSSIILLSIVIFQA